ncbi:MAG: hypothetical protein Q8N31_01465 [Reyranella sp.]|nr:hypothetical protein [Reyranella sp.]MDP3158658.1 hypothetical protein [Reyranella sp.]
MRHYEAQFGRVTGEVPGHFHPVAELTVCGRGFRRRCFLTDGHRLILLPGVAMDAMAVLVLLTPVTRPARS